MEDLSKVDARRLYLLLKNVIVGLMMIVITMALGKLLPEYLSPIVSLGCIGYLYAQVMRARAHHMDACVYTYFVIFICLVLYTIISVALAIMDVTGFTWFRIPEEMSFSNYPYVPSLIMMPLCAVVFAVMYFMIGHTHLCRQCRAEYGQGLERGQLGTILHYESRFQIRNLFWLFFVLSILVWLYFIYVFSDGNTNRDWYIFTWVVIIGIVLDQVYFICRYYNLYMQLQESGRLISIQDLESSPKKTYARIYLVCGNEVYVKEHLGSKYDSKKDHIDTPYVMSFDTFDVSADEVKRRFEKEAGVEGGELRLFYKRQYLEYLNQYMNRYFYFLEGEPSDYPQLHAEEHRWISVKEIKNIYQHSPSAFRRMFLADISRLATIMMTAKMYHENGERRYKLQSYHPTFDFREVKASDIDFNSNKWIRVSTDNEDSTRWRLGKVWRKAFGTGKHQSHIWL